MSLCVVCLDCWVHPCLVGISVVKRYAAFFFCCWSLLFGPPLARSHFFAAVVSDNMGLCTWPGEVFISLFVLLILRTAGQLSSSVGVFFLGPKY